MIDDEDGKVRRNLVVYSTLVIVVTFLGIQPAQVLLKLIGVDQGQVSPWRVWVVSAAVLLYLWYRFSTVRLLGAKDHLTLRSRPSAASIVNDLWEAPLLKVLANDLGSYSDSMRSKMRAVSFEELEENLAAYVAARMKPLQASTDFRSYQGRWSSPTASAQSKPRASSRTGSFEADVSVLVLEPSSSSFLASTSYRANGVKYSLPLLLWWLMVLQVAPRAIFTTDAGLQHNLPRFLAVCAAACIAWQFGCIAWMWWRSGTV